MSVEDSGNNMAGDYSGDTTAKVPHTISAFDKALADIRGQVLTMGDAVMQNVEDSIQGLLAGSRDRCNQVIAEDEVIDQAEKDIDEAGMLIMMRYKPVATDLRRVLSAMNMSRMLERIADHSVNIARQSRKMLKIGGVDEVKLVEPLFTLAIGELRDALTAYADDDEELALSLETRDDELDKLHKQLTKSLSTMIEERPEGSAQLIHLLFISRSLERIGDLSVNLGEEVVFIESAKDIRHESHS